MTPDNRWPRTFKKSRYAFFVWAAASASLIGAAIYLFGAPTVVTTYKTASNQAYAYITDPIKDLPAADYGSISAQVRKSVIDADLTYPYGLTLYEDASGIENLILGNTVGLEISNPKGISDVWPCSSGVSYTSTGEIYRYQFSKEISKTYVKTYRGFVERGTHFRHPNGNIDLYFVENRDGHIIKIHHEDISKEGRHVSGSYTSTARFFDFYYLLKSVVRAFQSSGWLALHGPRPYDIKVADLGGGGADIMYSTYDNNQLFLRKFGSKLPYVLADNLTENRTVELFNFKNDTHPSIITTGVGEVTSKNPSSGWVSILRNRGNYKFDEYRFDVRGAAYARLVNLDVSRPEELHLVVSHGLRDEIQQSSDHGLSVYRYFEDDNTIRLVAEIRIPYLYRFDLQDVNYDGVLDIIAGGAAKSGNLTMLLSRKDTNPTYDVIPIDGGLVSVNDIKFGRTESGVATVYLVADNGNGCPRKLGGSRLVRYQFTLPLSQPGK